MKEGEGEKKKKSVCVCLRFIHICSVPNAGSAQRRPIVGRNDNPLYLALQTAREMNAVSSLASRLSCQLSSLSHLLILSGLLSLTDASLFLSLSLSSLLNLTFSFLLFCVI